MHENASPVQIFAALADDSRWQVLVALGRRPASASALAEELPISRQALAHHPKVLTDLGLVPAGTGSREGNIEALGARPRGRPRPHAGVAPGGGAPLPPDHK
ncbi:helix-turn-helix domain-containing protein, partial [Mycolicibacterium fortuitum]|uniref:ArsR/SmtB family transcription factor n=1 Tax=Mycolicibacterium fortuitum TaxID=1766 RepID=UPI0034CFA6EE